jgi:hypothetical protein
MLSSSAQMKELRSLLVLAVALLFGVSFALPAEDIPETPYDESETLPYEVTPLFSIVLQEPARAPRSVLTLVFPLHFSAPLRCGQSLVEQSERTPHPISASVTILDHSFRC